jgi:hypothetical protein
VAEFTARRHTRLRGPGNGIAARSLPPDTEIGAALTLTSRSTHLLIERATMLQELPATAEALAGRYLPVPATVAAW